MKIRFWKMSGSGNDFVIIDNRKKALKGNVARWAKRLCYRQEGVGADGLLLLEPSRSADFRMIYFNADGSRAGMCGNGARCMAWFAHQHRVVGSQFTFQTDAYPVHARVNGNRVRISLGDAKDYSRDREVAIGPTVYRVDSVNTGVPHAVVFVRDTEQVAVRELGRAMRTHAAFKPAGTNVNFVQSDGRGGLKVRTYERGVEDETLACGTGVAASALAAAQRGLVTLPAKVQVRGGDVLTVSADGLSRLQLEGPVRLIFKGEIEG